MGSGLSPTSQRTTTDPTTIGTSTTGEPLAMFGNPSGGSGKGLTSTSVPGLYGGGLTPAQLNDPLLGASLNSNPAGGAVQNGNVTDPLGLLGGNNVTGLGNTGGFANPQLPQDMTPSWLTPWLTGAGSPFAIGNYGSSTGTPAAPLSTLNQMANQPTQTGVDAWGNPIMNYSGMVNNTQQYPWWSAFSQTPGTQNLQNLQNTVSNFENMWGFANPALLPLLLLEQSRALSPLQVSVPPVTAPPPLPPVIQPGNPAPSPLGPYVGPFGAGGGGGGGGDSGGGGGDQAPPPPPPPPAPAPMQGWTSVSVGDAQPVSPGSTIYVSPSGSINNGQPFEWMQHEPKGD